MVSLGLARSLTSHRAKAKAEAIRGATEDRGLLPTDHRLGRQPPQILLRLVSPAHRISIQVL